MPRDCRDCLHLSSMEHNHGNKISGGWRRMDRSIMRTSIVEGRICCEDLCVWCPDCVLCYLRNVRKYSYVIK